MVRGKSTRLSILLTVLATAVLATCTDPEKVSGPRTPTPPPPNPPVPPSAGPPASLQITANLSDLWVNESRFITVVVKDSAGNELYGLVPTFTSSDTSIAVVSTTGMLVARWPGVARIDVAVASLRGSVTARVASRLRIGLELIADWTDVIELAVGDTVRLKPYVTDANGRYVDVRPTVTWSSTNPTGISVNSQGKVTALEHGATAEIRAVGPEGVAIKSVKVSVPLSGSPATIRLAHAIAGLGPITFVPTKGPSKTLQPGQSATLEVSPGIFLVQAKEDSYSFREFPSVEGMTIRGGERVTLYAVGNPSNATLTWVWANNAAIPPGTAKVDVMAGGTPGYSVIYIQQAGQPLLEPPANCYFDWTDFAFWEGNPGPLDLFFFHKYPDKEVRAQLQVEAVAGTRKTVILAGTPTSGMTYFSFPDP